MKFYLDTEFTSFSNPKLMSLGLVSEDGVHEFYGELAHGEGWERSDCHEFVIENVIPLFTGKTYTWRALSAYLKMFLCQWDTVEIIADYSTDIDLFVSLFLSDIESHHKHKRFRQDPFNIKDSNQRECLVIPLMIQFEDETIWQHCESRLGHYKMLNPKWIHHALFDAAALRYSMEEQICQNHRVIPRFLDEKHIK